MRLLTSDGELSLPEDFSFEINVNNPIYSTDGTSSIPATIPASRDNSRVLGYLDRPFQAKRPKRSFDAILKAGPVHRRCTLLVDNIATASGISVSLALKESDLYSKVKDKKLKDIFSGYQIQLSTANTPADAASVLWHCYKNNIVSETTADDGGGNTLYYSPKIRVFPAGVELSDNVVKLINETNSNKDGFVFEARSISSGDGNVNVPAGYGVSAYLHLYVLVRETFEHLGYTIATSALENYPFRSIVVVNNCSDSLCAPNALIRMSDLVPTMTVGDLIVWLKDKFGMVVSVSNNKISIRLIQELLTSDPDKDVTSLSRAEKTVTYPATSRVVLSCDTSLDSASPAATSLKELNGKHPDLAEVNSTSEIIGQGLFLVRPLGKLYFVAANYAQSLLGSNTYKYDRDNSEKTEGLSSDDVFLPMIIQGEQLIPYIGDRLHYHTAISGKDEETEQPLKICYAFYDSNNKIWYGTTQPYDKAGTRQQYEERLSEGETKMVDYPSLTPEGMYAMCWKAYNEILLNAAPAITVKIDYPIVDALEMDILTPKMYKGLKVIIKSYSFSTSKDGINCGNTVLQVLPSYKDMVVDSEITFSVSLKWQLESTLSDELAKLRDEIELISSDGLTSYTTSDAPVSKPTAIGAIALWRQRNAVYREYYDTEKTIYYDHAITWEEYFIGVASGN